LIPPEYQEDIMTYQEQATHLLEEADDRRSEIRRNPVTGGHFHRSLDPLAPQIRIASKALEARDWFASQRPPDATELPLTSDERERIKVEGVGYIVALLARPLAMRDYEIKGHPRFPEYARGVMASPFTPDFIRNNPQLLREYPPTPLPGLGGGLIWGKPKQ
jgi:hypothetical protein